MLIEIFKKNDKLINNTHKNRERWSISIFDSIEIEIDPIWMFVYGFYVTIL